MLEKIEELIKMVYQSWKRRQPVQIDEHPDLEALACFCAGSLPQEERVCLEKHLVGCAICLEAVTLNLNVQETELIDVPQELLEKARAILNSREKNPCLEVILRVKGKIFEVVSASGDILVGQELVPAPVFRRRNNKDFKNEVTIFKDFNELRLEIKIENKGGDYFSLKLQVKKKNSEGFLKDLRVTLIKDDLELESYLSDTGLVSFEHILLGKYRLELTAAAGVFASVALDVKA